MLDIATLLVSMGLQEEMKEVRQEGAFVNEEEQQEESMLSTAAETASDMLTSAEETVCGAAASLIPSWSMVEEVMPESAAVTIDLSLPASSITKKG